MNAAQVSDVALTSFNRVATLSSSFAETDVGKAAMLLGLVLAIVSIVAFIYTGSVSRNLIGPIDIVPPRGQIAKDVLQIPNALVSANLSGLHAECTFFMTYQDSRGRSCKRRIIAKPLQITVVGRRLSAPPRNQSPLMIVDAYQHVPNLTFDNVEVIDGENIAVDPEVGQTIMSGALKQLKRPIAQLEGARKIPFYSDLRAGDLAKHRPAQDKEPLIYMQMRFPFDPYFVLFRHPDREVKTTAWLTVLTSIFALFMQLVYG